MFCRVDSDLQAVAKKSLIAQQVESETGKGAKGN